MVNWSRFSWSWERCVGGVAGSIFPRLVHCTTPQALVSVGRTWYHRGWNWAARAGREQDHFFSVLALAYCLHWSLFSRLIRTVCPFLAAGAPAKRSHLRRTYKVQVRVLSSQQPVSQGQAFLLLMVPVVKILMKVLAGVTTSRLGLHVITFSVEQLGAAKRGFDDGPHFIWVCSLWVKKETLNTSRELINLNIPSVNNMLFPPCGSVSDIYFTGLVWHDYSLFHLSLPNLHWSDLANSVPFHCQSFSWYGLELAYLCAFESIANA